MLAAGNSLPPTLALDNEPSCSHDPKLPRTTADAQVAGTETTLLDKSVWGGKAAQDSTCEGR